MRRPKVYILLIATTVLLAFAQPYLRVSAQARIDAKKMMENGKNANLGGSNPFDKGEENRDSTKTDSTAKKRIKRPLESYHFNDSVRSLTNFSWTISRDFDKVKINHIDTTLNDFNIDYPFYKKGVGEAAIGGLGQGSLPFDYAERPNKFNFNFTEQYHSYIYDMETVPFYNVKLPMIMLTYLESGQRKVREVNFDVLVAQNFSPSTGFNVNYKNRGTKGLYEWQKQSNQNLEVAFSHTGKRYTAHAAYFFNSIKSQENGGVVGDWAITDTTYDRPSAVPMKLSGAQANNHYRNHGFFVQQAVAIPLTPVTKSDFSLAELPTLYIGHSFEFDSWSRVYTDLNVPYTDDRGSKNSEGVFEPVKKDYYDKWYINPAQTRDSTFERLIGNRLFLQLQPYARNGVIGTVDVGAGVDVHTYSQLGLESFLSGDYKKVNKVSYYAYAGINGKIKRYVDWSASGKYYPSGYRGGDLDLKANIAFTAFARGHAMILEGKVSQELREPSYWQQNLFSNHYVWFSPLSKEKESKLEVSFRVPDYILELRATQSIITDKVYYDTGSLVAQHSGTISVTGLYARKEFRINGFCLDHRVLVQWSSNQEVVPVPLVAAYASYAYEFWAVRNVLKFKMGVDCRFNTKYYAPGYNPALAQFYNQRQVKVGDYPYMNVFVTAKWQRMRIFLKYQHFNKGLFGNDEYFAIAHQPLNSGMFKFGISWGFYD